MRPAAMRSRTCAALRALVALALLSPPASPAPTRQATRTCRSPPPRASSTCAGTSPCATSTSPSISTAMPTASSPGAKCAPPGRASRRTRCGGWPSRAARSPRSDAASSAATTAPMRCCSLRSACTLPAGAPRISYGLFADVDPTHRGIAKVQRAGQRGRVVGARADRHDGRDGVDPSVRDRGGERRRDVEFDRCVVGGCIVRGDVGPRALGVPPRRDAPHPHRLRPRPLPALPAPAVGDAQGAAWLAAGRAARPGGVAGGRHRLGVHRRALDHPRPGRTEAGLADAGVHRAGDRRDDRPRRARQPPADLSGAPRRRRVLLRPHPRLRLRRRARRAQPAARGLRLGAASVQPRAGGGPAGHRRDRHERAVRVAPLARLPEGRDRRRLGAGHRDRRRVADRADRQRLDPAVLESLAPLQSAALPEQQHPTRARKA